MSMFLIVSDCVGCIQGVINTSMEIHMVTRHEEHRHEILIKVIDR